MREILTQYLEILLNAFQYDVNFYSQKWVYAWILIPAFFYTVFFFVKWVVLTAPIWLPFRLIFANVFRVVFQREKDTKKKENDI